MPPVRGAAIRASTAPITCSATVRPNRAIHAFGAGSAFAIVPVATPSPSRAPVGLDSVNVKVSSPSSWLSSRIRTRTVFEVSPGRKVSVPEVAV